MKRNLLITPLFITLALFTAGCENPFAQNDEIQLDSPELEMFSSDLENDLNLSDKSARNLRSALGRHGRGGERDREPGFLWKLAAELQQTLTEEEKNNIFTKLEEVKEKGKDRGKDADKDRGKKDGGALRVIYSVLTDDQKPQFDAIMEAFRTGMDAIFASIKAGEMTREEAKAEIESMEETMKSAIDALLTDDQKAQLEQMRADRNAEKKAYMESVRQAKIEALGLTDDQITAIEAARAETKAAMEALKAQVESEDQTKEEAREAAKAIFEANKTAMDAIFTATQIEIIKIHKYLEMRWRHNKERGGKGGEKDGRDG
jgi:coenzyme F420-reducing hydrogenase delta subunit